MYVIFPMAGEGSRFGYKFKPFIKATDLAFIELAKAPFDFLKPTFVFVFREDQEKREFVSSNLHKLFPKDDIILCIIKESIGPFDTCQQAVRQLGLMGPAFVCDCDHSIDVTPMLHNIGKKFDVIVPIWKSIKPADYNSWGKIKFNKQNQIVSFHEKEIPELQEGDFFHGIIGCHLFSDIQVVSNYPVFENFSSLYKKFLEESRDIFSCEIMNASFFGTPKFLEEFRFKRASTYTLFIDVEGTIIDQETKITLPNTVNTLNKWRNEGHKIILVTASNVEIDDDIPRDSIIRELSSGPRIVINDSKPYLPFYDMADGIKLERNYGIQDIDLSLYVPPKIVKELKGGSGDRIFVIEDGRVRKWSHSKKLKKQYVTLTLLTELIPEYIPKLLGEHETSTDYYYDMEYLNSHKSLHNFDKNIRDAVCLDVISKLKDNVYCLKKPIINPEQWLTHYLSERVFPRLHEFENINPCTPTISHMLENIELSNFLPKYASPIHGDLTYENILWSPEERTFKLIDPNSSNFLEPSELDIGKMLQSELCLYESWENFMDDGSKIPESIKSVERPSWILEDEYDIGIFYMVTHLIRLTPYVLKRSEHMAKFSLLLAHYYLLILYRKYQKS